MDSLRIRGARQHNLRNVSLDLPRNRLIVITGVSGSGKSSLAFDTIFAEGQRRYVESLSAYARQFLEQMEKPDVDSIDGRHRHRNLRLPAPPLRLGRRPALHELRPGDPPADDPADGRPSAEASQRYEVHDPRAVHPRQEGRVPQA